MLVVIEIKILLIDYILDHFVGHPVYVKKVVQTDVCSFFPAEI
jgi:hypothetical protein